MTEKAPPLFKEGERVNVPNAGYRNRGIKNVPIIEYRGPLGGNGAHLYRVLLWRKPRPVWVELIESEMEKIVPELSPAPVPLSPPAPGV